MKKSTHPSDYPKNYNPNDDIHVISEKILPVNNEYLLERVDEVIQAWGFKGCFFGAAIEKNRKVKNRCVFMSTFNEAFMKEYKENQLIQDDLIAHKCCTQESAYDWSKDAAELRSGEPSKRYARLFHLAHAHDVEVGGAVSYWSRSEALRCWLWVGGRKGFDAESFSELFRAKRSALTLLLAASRDQLIKLAAQKSDFRLSPRERQCLALLSYGYRPNAIGEKLNTSSKTVQKQIKKGVGRLRAATRDEGVANAMRLRQLEDVIPENTDNTPA